MTYSDAQIKDLVLGLFKQESDRDKQRKVGASNISDPCTRHLAHALVATKEAPQKYWLGGKLGTATHEFIERRIDFSDDGVFAHSYVERKIRLGEIPNYGVVSSKPDLVLPDIHHLIDWKTSTRAKTKKLQAMVDGIKEDPESEYTLQKYIGQTQLYAWGLNNSGTLIKKINIVFINRDGTNENDFWVFTVDYDESIALQLWDRVTKLWEALENGAHPNDFPETKHCYKCQ